MKLEQLKQFAIGKVSKSLCAVNKKWKRKCASVYGRQQKTISKKYHNFMSQHIENNERYQTALIYI